MGQKKITITKYKTTQIMPLMKWTDQYSVGIGEMDEQHKVIFDIINELFDSLREGNDSDVLGIINRLQQYTQEHFAEEEQMLEEAKNPELVWQREEHLEFEKKVEEFKQKAAKESLLPLEKELSRFLMTWWNKHILDGDKKYAPKVHPEH